MSWLIVILQLFTGFAIGAAIGLTCWALAKGGMWLWLHRHEFMGGCDCAPPGTCSSCREEATSGYYCTCSSCLEGTPELLKTPRLHDLSPDCWCNPTVVRRHGITSTSHHLDQQ